MSKGRAEAFSDGVLAIVITIMVLELKAPHKAEWHELRPLIPEALSYLLSFFYLGIFFPIAFAVPLVSCALYVVVALIWLIPDRRIETVLREHKS
jgi:uncharacterized membrane protein